MFLVVFIFNFFLDHLDDATMRMMTGLTNEQFNELFSLTPSLRCKYKNENDARNALLMYMRRLRSGHTYNEIGHENGLSDTTVIRRIKEARAALLNDFVPLNLGNLSRNELLAHKTEISNELFCSDDPNAIILIWDATYIYIDKSENLGFQKDSWLEQKKRNSIKPMMCVLPDGFIVNVYGPYSSRKNDAKILEDIISKYPNTFAQFRKNDVMIVDRGFRDVVKLLRQKGYTVHMPAQTDKKTVDATLTSLQANSSRLVTKVRYVVEARNGHLKSVFKTFDQNWDTKSLDHLMDDLQIASALLNKYFKLIISDKNNAGPIADKMLSRKDIKNPLDTIIDKNSFQREICKFQPFENPDLCPRLSLDDLKLFAQGSYRLKLAAGYYQEHIKENDNNIAAFVCPYDVFSKYFQAICSKDTIPFMLLMKIKSRYQSTKSYFTFVIFDSSCDGLKGISHYICDCKNGKRVVGCCAHVMLIVWYFCYARHQEIIKVPSAKLNNFFDYEPND